jgi:hypothetical protein
MIFNLLELLEHAGMRTRAVQSVSSLVFCRGSNGCEDSTGILVFVRLLRNDHGEKRYLYDGWDGNVLDVSLHAARGVDVGSI